MIHQELIVPFNKEATKIGLIICSIMIGVLGYSWYMSFRLDTFFGFFISQIIRSILFFTLILFTIGVIYGLFMQKDSDPAARLSSDGIWVKHFGFIPWSEIEQFGEYAIAGTPMVAIGIRVKNLKLLSKQATLSGKSGVFWSKIFGYPPIIISNIALDNDQVIGYARRFKPE